MGVGIHPAIGRELNELIVWMFVSRDGLKLVHGTMSESGRRTIAVRFYRRLIEVATR